MKLIPLHLFNIWTSKINKPTYSASPACKTPAGLAKPNPLFASNWALQVAVTCHCTSESGKHAGHGSCREEFVEALKLDRQLTGTAKVGSTDPPSFRMCISVMLAAGVPFVGFGFLDNSIMVCESIATSTACKPSDF